MAWAPSSAPRIPAALAGLQSASLAGSGRVVHRFVPVAIAVEQSHDYVGTVQLRVDIEGLFVAVGAVIAGYRYGIDVNAVAAHAIEEQQVDVDVVVVGNAEAGMLFLGVEDETGVDADFLIVGFVGDGRRVFGLVDGRAGGSLSCAWERAASQ